jgi:large subunit ribosomal protein L17
MLRNLATSLSLEGKVKTTSSRAKALIAYYEHLVALAKRHTGANAVRLAKQYIYTEAAQKAFLKKSGELSGASGYLRATKLGFRPGDNAEVSLVEFAQ